MIFRNFRIIFRIGLVIAIFCFLIIFLGVLEYFSLRTINAKLDQLVYHTFIKTELAQDMRFLARHKAVLIRNILLVEKMEEKEFELQRIHVEEKDYNEALARLASLLENSDEKALLGRIIKGQNETQLLWEQVIQLGMNGRAAEGMRLLVDEVRSRQWGWLDSLNEMVEMQNAYARDNYMLTVASSSRTMKILVLMNLLAVALGLFFAIAISRSITGPLSDFTSKVEKIAKGDLSVQVEYDTKDEIGLLGKNINRMVKLRKKYEEELDSYRLHLEELVEQRTGELNRQREQFISVLIHDLKGSLTPILGFTRRLMDGKTRSPEDTATYLQTIENSALQLLDTIEKTSSDLRDKSALDDFHPEQLDIIDLTRTIATSFLPRAEDKRITISINQLEKENWDRLEPVMFRGDPSQLKTMIENLLGNAVKYARRVIHLEVGQKGDNAVHFIVSDDGPGIAREYRKKIFEQYFQIPGSRKGTGIGLYSVLKVVENHGGAIDVDSEPGRGATFRVRIPARV
jgi:signal transduction histidine kinase